MYNLYGSRPLPYPSKLRIICAWRLKLKGWPQNTDPRSMEPPYGLVHGPLYGPVHGPTPPPQGHPLRTPHKKTIRKMTIRDLTHCLFCFVFLLLLPPSLWRWKEDMRTSKKTDNLANLCIRCRPRLPPPFCSAHSSSYSVTRPRLQKYDTVSPVVFMFFIEQTHGFFFPYKKRFLKKFQLQEDSPIFHFS